MRTKVLPWTKENVDRYKSGDNLLRHAKTGPDIQGKILVGTQGDLIGYIAWSPDYIVALEVSPEYRGQGIATRLLEECPVKRLTVSCSNLGAIKLYKDLGYQVYRREPKILYMKKTYQVKRFSRIFQKEFGLAQKVGEAVKKIKPKSVKRINKKLKRKKLLESTPSWGRHQKAIQASPSLEDAALREVRQHLKYPDYYGLSKADYAVYNNQRAKSMWERGGGGLYEKNPDPIWEKIRQGDIELMNKRMKRKN